MNCECYVENGRTISLYCPIHCNTVPLQVPESGIISTTFGKHHMLKIAAIALVAKVILENNITSLDDFYCPEMKNLASLLWEDIKGAKNGTD